MSATSGIPDRNLVGLTYHLYGGSVINPTIGESVRKLNDRSSFDGIPLKDHNRSDPESKLRHGQEILWGG